jgi:hypothetical protein
LKRRFEALGVGGKNSPGEGRLEIQVDMIEEVNRFAISI